MNTETALNYDEIRQLRNVIVLKKLLCYMLENGIYADDLGHWNCAYLYSFIKNNETIRDKQILEDANNEVVAYNNKKYGGISMIEKLARLADRYVGFRYPKSMDPLSHDDVVEFITRCSGGEFEPSIIDIFLNCSDDLEHACDNLMDDECVQMTKEKIIAER
ncbi:MAG: hypothetical protein LBN22_03270 [Clostridiales Family XIII bacterium]|nr:hypothetical protein [Clostridiales Family XIII bacterium]